MSIISPPGARFKECHCRSDPLARVRWEIAFARDRDPDRHCGRLPYRPLHWARDRMD